MKKIVFASGKGGAGKTGISTAFFKAYPENTVMVDCDVDASNCFIILDSCIKETTPFFSGFKYSINEQICSNCGICVNYCQFKAIKSIGGQYVINGFLCEGCGAGTDPCKAEAIVETKNYCGDIYDAEVFNGAGFFYAKLFPGEDNSGKLITELKNRAFKYYQI